MTQACMGKSYTETTHFGHKLGMIVSKLCRDNTHLDTSYMEMTHIWRQVRAACMRVMQRQHKFGHKLQMVVVGN